MTAVEEYVLGLFVERDEVEAKELEERVTPAYRQAVFNAAWDLVEDGKLRYTAMGTFVLVREDS